jgi:hypothetical protein
MKNLEQFIDKKIEETHKNLKYHEERLIDEEQYLSYLKGLAQEENSYKFQRAVKDVEWRKEEIQNEKYMLDVLYTARDCKADKGFNYEYSVT